MAPRCIKQLMEVNTTDMFRTRRTEVCRQLQRSAKMLPSVVSATSSKRFLVSRRHVDDDDVELVNRNGERKSARVCTSRRRTTPTRTYYSGSYGDISSSSNDRKKKVGVDILSTA